MVNSQFVTKILDVIYDPLDDNVRISVSLIDTTHPTTDIYIEKQLVEDKRAVYLCVWFMYNSVQAGYDLCTTVYQDMKKMYTVMTGFCMIFCLKNVRLFFEF